MIDYPDIQRTEQEEEEAFHEQRDAEEEHQRYDLETLRIGLRMTNLAWHVVNTEGKS